MALNIKSAEADRLVKELASLTGESKTQAVVEALRERLERQRLRRDRDALAAELLTIGAGIVIDSQVSAAAGRQLDAFIKRAEIRVEAVTHEHADLARQAYLDFGKGNHEARLDFGDCFAYALSRATGLPLLFKGDDFARTDVASALPRS